MTSTLALRQSFRALAPDRAVGPDPEGLRERFTKIVIGEQVDSVTLGQVRTSIQAKLAEACEEAAAAGWDGYGAQPVDPKSAERAEIFLFALPTTVPVPDDVTVHPDGSVAFEWYRGPRRVFAASTSSNDTVDYAGLYGRARLHGSEPFVDEVPEEVLEGISRLQRGD